MSSAAPAQTPGPRTPALLVAATFVASLAAALAIAVTLHAGPRITGDPPSIEVAGNAMTALKGRARIDGSAIVLEALDGDGVGLISAPAPAFAADEYSRVAWRIASDVARDLDLVMVWRTAERPGRTFTSPFDWSRGDAEIDLAGHPDWRGTIQGVALAARGRLPVPLAVAGLSARSNAWTATFADVVGEWLGRPFGGGARSFAQVRGEAKQIAPLLTVVAGGVALAVAFLLLRARRRREPVARWAIAACFLAGWLVLDLRFQAILWRQHTASFAQFAGRTTDQKNAAEIDAPIFDVARKVRDAARARGGRILVLSDNTHLATRVGWFLYPDNVYYDSRPRDRAGPPAPDELKPGDQVVLLLYGAIAWDAARGTLVWADGRTRAAREILSDGPGLAFVEIP